MSVYKQFQEEQNAVVQISNKSSSISDMPTHKKSPHKGIIKTPLLKETEKRLIPKIKQFNGPSKQVAVVPPPTTKEPNTIENKTEASSPPQQTPAIKPVDETTLRKT